MTILMQKGHTFFENQYSISERTVRILFKTDAMDEIRGRDDVSKKTGAAMPCDPQFFLGVLSCLPDYLDSLRIFYKFIS